MFNLLTGSCTGNKHSASDLQAHYPKGCKHKRAAKRKPDHRKEYRYGKLNEQPDDKAEQEAWKEKAQKQ